jgi:hypothetical protein
LAFSVVGVQLPGFPLGAQAVCSASLFACSLCWKSFDV